MTRRSRLALLLGVVFLITAPLLAAGGWALVQIRRAERIEAELEAEIQAERARVERRPVLRGRPSEHDVGRAIAMALASRVPGEVFAHPRLYLDLYQKAENLEWESAPVETTREALAPTVTSLRAAITGELVSVCWSADGQNTTHRSRLALASVAFLLEAGRALRDGETESAALLLADLLRLRQDARRTGLSDGAAATLEVEPGAGKGLALVIDRLDEPGLSSLDAELARLEDTAPAMTPTLRRTRLWEARRILSAAQEPASWGLARARRVLAVWNGRLWQKDLAAFLDQEAVADFETRSTVAARLRQRHGEEWDGRLNSTKLELTRRCEELDEDAFLLHAARVGVCAERHRRATGRWPDSLDELALPPGAHWRSPIDDAPLRITIDIAGLHVWDGPATETRHAKAWHQFSLPRR